MAWLVTVSSRGSAGLSGWLSVVLTAYKEAGKKGPKVSGQFVGLPEAFEFLLPGLLYKMEYFIFQ